MLVILDSGVELIVTSPPDNVVAAHQMHNASQPVQAQLALLNRV